MDKYSSRKVLVWTVIISILLAIIGASAFGIYAKHKQTVRYDSSRSIMISHQVDMVNKDSNNIVQSDINMMPTYKQLFNDYKIAKETYQNLPENLKKKYTISDIYNDLSASISDQSVILKVTAKTSSPKDSTVIANTAAKVFAKDLKQVKPDAGNITLLSSASSKDVDVDIHPHLKKYVAVGFILGGLIGLVFSIVWFTILDLK